MASTLIKTLILLIFTGICNGLIGPNICSEMQNYTLTRGVKYQVPVIVKIYKWCFSIPPKCSTTKSEMRDKWKVETQQYSKPVDVCCPGFREDNDKCLPKCPSGVTGHACKESCTNKNWGPSCLYNCRCPTNSKCDSVNGKCICKDGWSGPGCNIPKDSFTRLPPILTRSQSTKMLFDWSSPTKYPIMLSTTILPSTTTANVNTQELSTITTEFVTMSSSDSTLPETQKTENETITESTTAIGTTIYSDITVNGVTVLPTTAEPSKPIEVSTKYPIIDESLQITTKNSDKVWVSQIEPPTEVKGKNISVGLTHDPIDKIPRVNNTLYKVTETPLTITTKKEFLSTLQTVKNIDSTITAASTEKTFTKPVVTTTSGKKKVFKIENRDSDIINIAIHKDKAGANVTTAVKPRSKYMGESKMVTIPVKVIFDSSPAYIKLRKNSQSKLNPTTSKPALTITTPSFIISSSSLPQDEVHTEEIGHVLAEPEHHTMIMGNEEDDRRKHELYSVLSAAGVAVAVIFVALIIVMISRFKKSRDLNHKKSHNNHIHSLRNIFEDDVQSSYFRNSFHSPIPDPPEIFEIKTTPVPFLHKLDMNNVSPVMLESFRDILECHYDHPKPLRQTYTSPLEISTPTYQVPLSTVRFVNGLSRTSDNNEGNFPVTEAAINTLKLESFKNCSFNEEHKEEPVYDEIPTWSTINLEVLKSGDEAITEL